MPTDVGGFSYVAAVSTLQVELMPREDYGAAVSAVERFVAADGPIALGVLASFGLSTALLANPLGDDEAGHAVRALLDRWGVGGVPYDTTGASPFSTVIASAAGTRTFFPYLPGVLEYLSGVPLDSLVESRWAYIDCYEVLAGVTERPVRSCLRHDTPLLLNLGGSPAPRWLTAESLGRPIAVLQSSVPDGDVTAAHRLHRDLRALNVAARVVVSAGSAGAVASSSEGAWTVEAAAIQPERVQGAGSSMSAGMLRRLVEGRDFAESVRYGCAVGTAWCLEAIDPPAEESIGTVFEKTKVYPA